MNIFSICKKYLAFIALPLLLGLAGCGLRLQKINSLEQSTAIDCMDNSIQPAPMAPKVTIWIHGTTLTSDKVMPHFFYRKQGLNPIKEYAEKYQLRKIANHLDQLSPELFPLEHFYSFGWNGKLSFQERERAAQTLYYELMNLCDFYHEKYNILPYIRIITHSHGGNVALNLAKVKEKNKPMAISELILLACPVQTETMNLINDDLFEKIYSFYSDADLLQIIDPQGLYHNKTTANSLFSQRLFPQNKKIWQIKTKTGNRGFAHIDFLFINKFLKHLPDVMKELVEKGQSNQNDVLFSLSFQMKKRSRTRYIPKYFILTTEQKKQSRWHRFAQKKEALQVTQNEEALSLLDNQF